MPTPKPALVSPDWLPKAAAAKLAGISTRQLERREAQGFVEKRVLPRGPMDRTAPVEYSRADLLALKSGKPNVHAREVREIMMLNSPAPPKTAALALAKTTGVHGNDPWDALAAKLAGLAAAFPSPAAAPVAKPWLTLAEAAEYSGLPAAFLVVGARAGTIRAVNVGTGKKEFWRFNREALAR